MNNSTQILIVEDEKNLGETLHDYLKNKNFSCDLAITAQMAEQKFKENNPNIVLMDIGLPDGSGIDLARKWREKSKNFVLLFLSAQNNPATRLEALELGGDDYITKPFELKELTLRLEKILKAQNFADTLPEIITHGPLKIYFKRFEIESA
nr:response regulator transcription factor [Bacteriovoracaceae bacterium]